MISLLISSLVVLGNEVDMGSMTEPIAAFQMEEKIASDELEAPLPSDFSSVQFPRRRRNGFSIDWKAGKWDSRYKMDSRLSPTFDVYALSELQNALVKSRETVEAAQCWKVGLVPLSDKALTDLKRTLRNNWGPIEMSFAVNAIPAAGVELKFLIELIDDIQFAKSRLFDCTRHPFAPGHRITFDRNGSPRFDLEDLVAYRVQLLAVRKTFDEILREGPRAYEQRSLSIYRDFSLRQDRIQEIKDALARNPDLFGRGKTPESYGLDLDLFMDELDELDRRWARMGGDL